MARAGRNFTTALMEEIGLIFWFATLVHWFAHACLRFDESCHQVIGVMCKAPNTDWLQSMPSKIYETVMKGR